jgi:galactokinase
MAKTGQTLMTDPISRASVLAAFQSEFNKPARVFRAPARINVIGEHSDYNDGFVMPSNTALYTWLAIAPREDRLVSILASDFRQTAELHLDQLEKDPNGGWQEYVKGVLLILQDEGFELSGADILIMGEIPLGGGLSSSASLETVMAFAMLSCAGYDIDRSQMALMCKRAENEFVGVACGIMDQYVISLCGKDEAMMLDCRSLDYENAPLPDDARLLIVNSGVSHSLQAGGYNKRRDECEQAVARLRDNGLEITALRDVSMEDLDTHREILGDLLYKRCKHVVTEIQRVGDAYAAMHKHETETLGSLMNQSHNSLRDDYEVSCSELDLLVDIARNCEGVFGSRMVGAGFGGCTVSLVKREKIKSVVDEICIRYREILGQDPWTNIVKASEPVQEIQ